MPSRLSLHSGLSRVVSFTYEIHLRNDGARCSSVVRAFVYGAMGRRVDPSWWTQIAISFSSQCNKDLCNKGRGMCHPVCGMMHIKEPLLLIGKSSP